MGKGISRLSLLRTTALAGALYAGSLGDACLAEAQVYTFDIPRQALALSLRDYARLSGQEIIFTDDLVANMTAAPLHGVYSADEALKRLLADTGLIVERATSGTFMIRKERHAAAERPPPAPPAAPPPTESITVTGTLITDAGYRAPTPVMRLAAADLLRQSPDSIPAALEQLPQFTMTSGADNYGTQAGTPGAGNYLNLRGLGAIESLTMVDGYRLPASSFNGSVDANIIPQAFVSRIDVVTGGASAAYGSDAVSGVINFVLDNNFNGVKGSLQGGTSTYGDGTQLKFSVAAGSVLLGGRAHVEASFDHFQQPRISCPRLVAGDCSRPNAFGYGLTGAGTAGNPYVLSRNLSVSNATFGTLITSASTASGAMTPFQYTGYQFAPNGAVEPFDPGTPTGTPNYGSNGQGAVSFGTSLTASVLTDQAYGRFDYDLSDAVSTFASLIYSEAKNSYVTVTDGSQVNAFQIFQDNAFLPPNVAAAMAAQHVAYFTGSRFEADQTPKLVNTVTGAWVGRIGVNGRWDDWKWSAAFSHGDSRLSTGQLGNFQQDRWYAALDAVRDPASGAIVCRATLTNPGLYPGCVPWDPFGNGAPSAAAYAYIEGVSRFQVHNLLDDLALQISGRLFDLPAGAVNTAAGFEYRYEQLRQTSNNNPAIPIDQTGLCHAVDANGAPTGVPVTPAQCNAIGLAPGIVSSTTSPTVLKFSTTNVGPSAGDESIEEGFFELAAPLLADSFVGSLDVNFAYRVAQYSISGSAQTWKIGFNWQPVAGLKVRGTISRDFRAPSLYELFAGQSATFGLFNDAIHSGQNGAINTYSAGNPDLKPEIGNTSTAGLVWTPAMLEGFTASLDYYTIRITNQINRLSSLMEDQICEASGGTDRLCAYIVRPTAFSNKTAASFPLYIVDVPYNQASVSETGFDLDIGYRLAMPSLLATDDAGLSLRFVGNYLPSLLQYTGIGGRVIQQAGAGNFPKLKFNFEMTYHDQPLEVGAGVRVIGTNYYSHDPTIFYSYNGGREAGMVGFLDLNASYSFALRGHSVSLYGAVKNAFNTYVFVPSAGLPYEYYPTNEALYNVVGRYFTTGLRFTL